MINIAGKLKKAPKGIKLFSPIWGECKFFEVNAVNNIGIEHNGELHYLSKFGQYNNDGECVLFPSSKCRSWKNFIKYQQPFEINSPYDFKPFDKVVGRDSNSEKWRASFYSHYEDKSDYPFQCLDSGYKYCLPYNEETANLIGTTYDYV